MKKYPLMILIVLLAALVVACQQQPDVVPTIAPAEETPVTEATAAPEAVATEAPAEATEVPAEATAEATAPPAVQPVAQFCDVVDPTLINLNTQGIYLSLIHIF